MFRNWRQSQKFSRKRAAAEREKAQRRAKEQRQLTLESLEDRRLMAITPIGIPNWQEQGPGPLTRGQVAVGDVVGPNARDDDFVGGPVKTIVVDPLDANRVLVGTASGGIWKTTNALSASPLWEQKTDLQPSLAITTIVKSAVDNTPSNPADDVLYAGTGSASGSSGDGAAGVNSAAGGILKSIDGGEHWSRLGQPVFQGLSIQSIVPTTANNGNVIVVATSSFEAGNAARRVPGKGGIYRSEDGGITWTRISGGDWLPDGGVTDLALHPESNRLYAAVSGDFDANHDGKDNDPLPWSNKGIYQSSDNGQTWIAVNDGLALPADQDGEDTDGDGKADAQDEHEGIQLTRRIKLVIGKSAPYPFYAAFISPAGIATAIPGDYEISGLYRGELQGGILSWRNQARPGTTELVTRDVDKDGVIEPGETSVPTFIGIHPAGQGDAYFALAVDPTDPNVIFIGGDRGAGSRRRCELSQCQRVEELHGPHSPRDDDRSRRHLGGRRCQWGRRHRSSCRLAVHGL